MKPRATFLLLSSAFTAFLLLSQISFAQQKPDDQAKAKKTITIHVTKEVNGDAVVIDTTIVTEGDFDADAFLKEKGVMDDTPGAGNNVQKHVIIRNQGTDEPGMGDSEVGTPDTIIINDDQVFVLKNKHHKHSPHMASPDMPYDFDFNMPQDFRPMPAPRFEDMLEGMARSYGLENMMPFGEMKQVVVKKKRNGKKVIITFEDRKKGVGEHEQGNRKKEEKVIIYRNGEQGNLPQNEERVMVKGKPGENVIIHKTVKKTENGDQVIINAEVENPSPVKTEKKVIIITEEGPK